MISNIERYEEELTMDFMKEYEKWLTKVYGNYMQLPPVEKRKTHHFTDVIDFDNSYTKYTEGNAFPTPVSGTTITFVSKGI